MYYVSALPLFCINMCEGEHHVSLPFSLSNHCPFELFCAEAAGSSIVEMLGGEIITKKQLKSRVYTFDLQIPRKLMLCFDCGRLLAGIKISLLEQRNDVKRVYFKTQKLTFVRRGTKLAN